MGSVQSELTRRAGVEIRVLPDFYMVGDTPEIIGVLHAAQDMATITVNRLS